MSEDIILRLIDTERDAEKLAEMWNDSDGEWPGTWTSGMPMTAQNIRDWHDREEYLTVHVWDAGDKIAGYCSLIHKEDEDEVVYLPLLNVSPHFQGKSLGRKILVNAVEKTIEEKKYRLDLDTWSGNFKAMAAYKRTGFFWDVGPCPLLRNFMPAILQMPCTRYFFDKHDWYRTLQGDLTHMPDDEQWDGLNVFIYRFDSGDDQLTVWADREARRITAVDTAEAFVAATVDDIEIVRGQSTTLRWKITNKKETPVALSLIAKEIGDLSVDYRAERSICAGETITLDAPVAISEKAGASNKSKAAPRITTQIRLDDTPIELGTGIRPQTEMSIAIHPKEVTLTPGVPQTIDFQFRSCLPDDVTVQVRLAPSEGLTLYEMQHTITLPARSFAGLSVVLRADRAGLFDLTASARAEWNDKTINLPADSYPIFSLSLGGLLYHQKSDAIRVENESYRIVLQAKGGDLSIKDRMTGKALGYEGARPVFPLWPSEYKTSDFILKAEQDGTDLVLTASCAPKKYPGIVFRRTLHLNAGPIIIVEHALENTGFDPYTFRLYHYAGNSNSQRATLTLALRDGLLRAHCSDRPAPSDDDFKRDDVYAETWGAYEMPHGTLGVLWPNDGDEITWSSEFEKITGEITCEPQSRHHFAPLQLYVGDGDWRTVRRIWHRTSGQKAEPYGLPPDPTMELAAAVEPAVPIVVGEKTEITVQLNHLRSRPTTGTLSLDVPDDWHCEPASFSFSEVNWQQPFSAQVNLSTHTEPGAYFGWLVVEGAERDTMTDFPLIRLGDGAEVTISDRETEGYVVHTIRNGRFEIDVIPSFLGIVSAIRDAQGVNHLASAFPKPSLFNANYPWHGGIQPGIDVGRGPNMPGILDDEMITVEPITHTDGYGIKWTGLRQHAVLTHEDVRGLTLELYTLTVGGSPVVKQIWRFINETSCIRRMQAGWDVFVQPDGDRSATVLFTEDYERKRSDRTYGKWGGHWGAAANPETGRTVALISPWPEVNLNDCGPAGGHLLLKPMHTVPAHGILEMIGYVVVTNDREDVRWFAALKDVQ